MLLSQDQCHESSLFSRSDVSRLMQRDISHENTPVYLFRDTLCSTIPTVSGPILSELLDLYIFYAKSCFEKPQVLWTLDLSSMQEICFDCHEDDQ